MTLESEIQQHRMRLVRLETALNLSSLAEPILPSNSPAPSSTAIIRILSLSVIGLILYLSGFLFRRMSEMK